MPKKKTAKTPKKEALEVSHVGDVKANPAEVFHYENLQRVAKRGMGRPPLLTPAVHQIIIEAIRLLGCSDADAAEMAGVSAASITVWKNRGEKETSGPYFEFLKDYRASRPYFVAQNRIVIANAAKTDFRAARMNLELADAKFGPRLTLDLSGFSWENARRDQLEAIANGLPPPP